MPKRLNITPPGTTIQGAEGDHDQRLDWLVEKCELLADDVKRAMQGDKNSWNLDAAMGRVAMVFGQPESRLELADLDDARARRALRALRSVLGNIRRMLDETEGD
ncbi:MAG TPA: hypothetical protein VK281_16810 [Xanthobacteraceae bacterium]|nr:hypothetical protein [Xanthobacteraceae bacterium]